MRKDILVYDIAAKSWLPPTKKSFVPSKHYKRISVESIDASVNYAYVVFKGQHSDNDQTVNMFVDRVNLSDEVPKAQGRVQFVCNLPPDWFTPPCAVMYDERCYLYVCGTKLFARLMLENQAWEKLPPPIGKARHGSFVSHYFF